MPVSTHDTTYNTPKTVDLVQNLTRHKKNTRPEINEHGTHTNHIMDGEDTNQVHDQNNAQIASKGLSAPLRWADEPLETEQPTKNDAKKTRKMEAENNSQEATQRHTKAV